MAHYVVWGVFILCMILIFTFYYKDSRKKRTTPDHKPYISFIVPCYNDGHMIAKTIQSIYDSYDTEKSEIIVINDCSTDNSSEVIRGLQSSYDFTFIDLPKNGGKAAALNHASTQAQYDIIAFIDADVIINPQAMNDVIARFHQNDKIGAISCPYTPANMESVWAKMQDIEYTMLKIVQGCYNMTSALAGRGGCLIVRKEAFEQIGKFELSAITEDMELVLRMNKHKRMAQQSNYTIQSEVPDTFKTRCKQKIRRCSGAIQAFITHRSTWIKNPIHMIFVTLLFGTTIINIIGLFTKGNATIDPSIGIPNTRRRTILCVTLPSLPYVIGSMKSNKERRKIFLIFPYTIIYMNIYSIIGLYSTGRGIYKFLTLKKGVRSR